MLTIETYTCPKCGRQFQGTSQYTPLCKCNRCGRRWHAESLPDDYRVCPDCIKDKPSRCDCGGQYEDDMVWMQVPPACDIHQISIPVWDADIVMRRISDGLYLSETVVTEALWDAVMNARGGHSDNQKNTPQTGVSPKQIADFLRKLQYERLNIQSDRLMLRLPTVYEWLYAAWNGTDDCMPYAGSDDLYSVAIYGQPYNGYLQKAPFVKQKLPTEQGVYDMSGGVWEICTEPDHQDAKFLMGGCFQSSRQACILPDVHDYYRYLEQINSLQDENYKSDTVGFRLATAYLKIEIKNENRFLH